MPFKRPPVKSTKEYTEAFIAKKKETMAKSPAFTKIEKRDRDYLLGMLDEFEATVGPKVDPNAKVDGKYRYTPIQMYRNCVAYFRASLEAMQPLTKMGIALYNGLRKDDFYEMTNASRGREMDPAFGFLKDCVDFVEMYIEYTGQKKQNPAFQIFWLKNRGWKDKFEIEATANQGALTDEEREVMQKRLKGFSEIKNNG